MRSLATYKEPAEIFIEKQKIICPKFRAARVKYPDIGGSQLNNVVFK